MVRVKLKHAFALLFSVVVLQLAFVNCSSRPSVDFAENKMASGGGDGYSGKLYVMLNPGGVCADGDSYRAKIEVTGIEQKASLLRENCVDIAPKPVDVVISSVDSNLLAYDQTAFREDSSLGVIA